MQVINHLRIILRGTPANPLFDYPDWQLLFKSTQLIINMDSIHKLHVKMFTT